MVITDDSPPPVKYVLYCHYGFHEKTDEQLFRENGPNAVFRDAEHLGKFLDGLHDLLNTPGHEGMLVLFYSQSFSGLLEDLARSDRRHSSEEFAFVAAVSEQVRAQLGRVGLDRRVRLITAIELKQLLGAVHLKIAENFPGFITGSSSGLRYDAPKIVEAILRMRLLGTGVPVFRVDQDVIFGLENKGKPDLGLFKPVACAVRAYQLRHENPNVTTFLFSASYDDAAVLRPLGRQDRFTAWSRAFATRVLPAVVANPVEISDISRQPVQDQPALWEEYLACHFNVRLARRFYGFKARAGSLSCNLGTGLPVIGAHPLYAVISGALLCLSEGAILDLPPFSNFRMNVMWIDDHLKYALHRAMNHFTNRERPYGDPSLSFARLEGVTVIKSRPVIRNLPVYLFGNYLPTLLWGAVMDAWISDDPHVKCRGVDLSQSERTRRDAARDRPPTAVLPRTLYNALQTGHVRKTPQLHEEFEQVALRRINEVRAQWSALADGRSHTFASYWARGEVERTFGRELFSDEEELLWRGIAPKHDLHTPITKLSQINDLRNHLNYLIDDALTYVEWTLEWPKFVQIIRSARQGDFAADVSWRPAEP